VKQEYETLAPVGMPRFPALDGWRGISILLVMTGHLFPLGPSRLGANAAVPAFGMAIFFTLSGFLITTTLLYRPSVSEFLIRRLCRIVPAAWAFSLVALTLAGVPASVYIAQLLFYSNLPPFWLTNYTGHLWSLGVEVQFYVSIAFIFLLFKRRGLWSLPFLCLAATSYRIYSHTTISIVTSLRADEILAGACLALVAYYPRAVGLRRAFQSIGPLILLPLAFAACFSQSGPLGYARPYLVAMLVGTTLFGDRLTGRARLLQARWLVYIAAISYALYILHPIVSWGWLASGSKVVKYVKRVPELAAVFGLAHLSTFYYEAFWIRMGKKWSNQKMREIGDSAAGGRVRIGIFRWHTTHASASRRKELP
jgi:peptidoglycan/LPS O-acetylase OafA/YrhL